MSNIFVKSIDFVKRHFWSMLLITFVSTMVASDGNPVILIKETLKDGNVLPAPFKVLFKVKLIFPISLLLTILSSILYKYINIEIYSAIKENRSPSVISAFKNIFNFGFDMFTLILMILFKTFLWTLLFVIPGIIKALEYQRAIYIKVSDPTISNGECFIGAKDEMDGKKLSLFGWEFLAGVILFILLVLPTMIFVVWGMGTAMITDEVVFGGISLYMLISFIIILLTSTVIITIEPMFNAELDELIYE